MFISVKDVVDDGIGLTKYDILLRDRIDVRDTWRCSEWRDGLIRVTDKEKDDRKG